MFSPKKEEGGGESAGPSTQLDGGSGEVGRALFGGRGTGSLVPGPPAAAAPSVPGSVPPPPAEVPAQALPVKALKKRLFHAAAALAEAEQAGAAPERTAQLRAAAEELNAEYRRAKAALATAANLG